MRRKNGFSKKKRAIRFIKKYFEGSYMTSFFSKRKKSSLTLVLAVIFLLSTCLFFMTACDDEDSNNSSTTSKTDNCAIANGNFEYYTDDDNLKLIVSPSSWTKSNGQDSLGNSASASTRASGIVNTASEQWDSFTKSKNPFEISESANLKDEMKRAAKQWDDMSVNDRLNFYEDLQTAIDRYNDKNSNSLSLSDFSKYSDYNYSVTAEDVPDCENPGTHDGNEKETSVLMIHNYRSDRYGTAQRYSSSTTVSLEAGTAAKVSVWVKTADLKYNGGEEVTGSRGANISVTHTVGGKTLDQMQINNINTAGVTENNGWVQYTLYIKACSYASSNFNIVLGLGQGSSSDVWANVEGYAFFDDVDMNIISNAEYDKATQNATGDYTVPYCTMNSSAEAKKFATDKEYKDNYVYALDLYRNLESFNVKNGATFATDLTSTVLNGVKYTTSNYNGLNLSTADDVTALTDWNALNEKTSSNKYLAKIWENDFDKDKYPFAKDESLLFLMSAHGAAYTSEMTSDMFTLDANSYLLISFWVKTSDTSGYTGATINLYDATNATSLGAYNTTTMSTVDLDDAEDIYDGWIQCFFFVENTTFDAKSFRLEFSYGPTTITGTTKASYTEGYAAFTGFTYYEMSESDFDYYAGSATQSTTVSLKGRDASASNGFDSTSTIDTQKIEHTLATPSNYKGVNGGSKWTTVGGTADEAANANASAGLLNKNYIGTYREKNEAWFTNLLSAANVTLTDSLKNVDLWNALFGTSTQPLLISNVVEQAYGYLSSTYNLSSSGYHAISVKVKVSAGAKAYIYLIDTSDLFKGYDSTAKVETINATYWYDDEGSVCMADPQGKDFNAKTQTAFYRMDNGLYKNNLDATDENVYANLANYEKDAQGNLIVKTDSNGNPIVSYDYATDYVDDGIAFYANDGKYYAYYDAEKEEYSTEVKDFSAASFNGKNFTAEYARYLNVNYLSELNATEASIGENVTVTGKTNTDTYIVVDGDQAGVAGKWITVSFYVHTGSDSFPYRLEVFSGSRDGKVKSAAGSYVAFDACNSGDLSSNYAGLLSEAIEDMTDKNGYTDSRLGKKVTLKQDQETGRLVYADGSEEGKVYENAQYYCYSFYDDAGYVRYDQTLDENAGGDPYNKYTQSSYSETLTYLYYESAISENEASYSMFLDYSAISQSVTKDTGINSDDNTDKTENKWWENPDFWWMFSSIALAVVLLFILVITVIRTLIKNGHKKPRKEDNRYNAKRMRYIRKMNLQTEEEDNTADEGENESKEDDDNPYND